MSGEKHVSPERLERLARGKAKPEEKIELLNHLIDCPFCMKRFTRYFDGMEQIKPPADFISHTAERIRAQSKAEETDGAKRVSLWEDQVRKPESSGVKTETMGGDEKRIPLEARRKGKGRGELLRYSARVSAAACAALILLFAQSWAFYGTDQTQGQEKWRQTLSGHPYVERSVEKIKASEWTLKGLTDHLFKWGGKEE